MATMRIATILQLVAASLLVGLVMTGLNLGPTDVYEGIVHWLVEGWRRFIGFWRWLIGEHGGRAVASILAGATVVLPVWLLFRLARGRRRS